MKREQEFPADQRMSPLANQEEALAALEQGKQAAAEGRRNEALRLVSRASELGPRLVDGWVWQGWLTEDPRLAETCFCEALRLQPDNRAAQAGLRALARHESATTAVPESTSYRLRVVLAGLILLLGVGMFWQWSPASVGAGARRQPELSASATPRAGAASRADAEIAWAHGRDEEAMQLWEKTLAAEPDDARLRARLLKLYVARATTSLQNQLPDQARPFLERAVLLAPDDKALAGEYEALRTYLAGRDALRDGDLDTASVKLATLYAQDPYYLDVVDLLYQTYMAKGDSLREKKQWMEARRAYANALRYHPRDSATQHKVAEMAEFAARPTPTPRPAKRIVVDISEQHFYAYEGDRLLYSLATSTGEPGRPTKQGSYHVQSKIRNARSNVWHLWMPYWLGIYWVGNIENGIHGLPVLDNGGKLWAGYLGQRVSFGCVILDDDTARQIFDWAEIGTEVVIQP